jgi:hypothetical protein
VTAVVTIFAVIVLAVMLVISPVSWVFVMFVGIIALGRWLTLSPRCPRCNERMVANWELRQDECRACSYGQYWKD